MKFQYFVGCILAAASMAVWPEIGLAHGGSGGHAGGGGSHGFGGPGGGHALSVVVRNLADSPTADLSRDSGGTRG
jgi:hypothetical protein